MPPSADQVAQIKNVLQAYRVQLRVLVAKHKSTTKKILAEADNRRAERIRKKLQTQNY